MSIHNINRRLDQLDARQPAETPRRVIRLIVGEDDEPQDEAIARWCAEHPSQDPDKVTTVMIVGWGDPAPVGEAS